MNIHPIFADAAFEPETIEILSKAYDAARTRLGLAQPDTVLEAVARRIIEEAHRGERNPERLLAYALRGLGGGAGQG